jgi:type I restriction enzyme S subunit
VKCIEDEIPFDVPNGWVWCRLQTICPYGDCEKVETKDIKPDEWILDLEDVEKDTGNIISVILKKDRNSVSTKHKFYKGQLLYSKLRPYLNKVVIAINDGYCTSEILPLKLFGSINPPIIRRVVVFPHPEGPSNVINSLSKISRSIPLSITSFP